MDELYGFGIFSIGIFISLRVDIEVFFGFKDYHVPLGRHLISPDLLGIIMILLGTKEETEESSHPLFLRFS
jgi:hypothetical protein